MYLFSFGSGDPENRDGLLPTDTTQLNAEDYGYSLDSSGSTANASNTLPEVVPRMA